MFNPKKKHKEEVKVLQSSSQAAYSLNNLNQEQKHGHKSTQVTHIYWWSLIAVSP